MTAPIAPAGAVAGWDLHPLESAAFARRTPNSDMSHPGASHKSISIADQSTTSEKGSAHAPGYRQADARVCLAASKAAQPLGEFAARRAGPRDDGGCRQPFEKMTGQTMAGLQLAQLGLLSRAARPDVRNSGCGNGSRSGD